MSSTLRACCSFPSASRRSSVADPPRNRLDRSLHLRVRTHVTRVVRHCALCCGFRHSWILHLLLVMSGVLGSSAVASLFREPVGDSPARGFGHHRTVHDLRLLLARSGVSWRNVSIAFCAVRTYIAFGKKKGRKKCPTGNCSSPNSSVSPCGVGLAAANKGAARPPPCSPLAAQMREAGGFASRWLPVVLICRVAHDHGRRS